jgi:hypothetical protein
MIVMNIPGKISQISDWIISILGVKLWGEYSGIVGFFKDLFGIITIPLPVPFWVATLVGVALSISFYRNHAAYKKNLSSKISAASNDNGEDSNREA